MTTQQALTDQQIDDIEARLTDEHLTPGPWNVEYDYCDCSEYGCSHGKFATAFGPFTWIESRDGVITTDAEFAAHAREDVPALLAEVRRQRAELADAQEEHAKLVRWHREDEKALARMRTTIERLRGELAEEQQLHGDTIDDRDRATDMADKLAYALASEAEIGEHTADNSPWQNALDLITPKAGDTLPVWLYQRFAVIHGCPPWDQATDDDRAYWEHQARAVRRAVARGGFKEPAAASAVVSAGAEDAGVGEQQFTEAELAEAQADVDHLNAEFPDEPQDGNGWPGDEHAEPGTRGWTV